jgi:hypothetical protein
LRSRGTGKRRKDGSEVREFFLPVPQWFVNEAWGHEGKRYEFRPDPTSGEIIYRPQP